MFRKKATKREILSLIGVLQYATRVDQPGRTSLRRMYATAAKLRKLHFFTRSIRSFDQTYAGGTFSSTARMAKVFSNAQPHRKCCNWSGPLTGPQYTSTPTNYYPLFSAVRSRTHYWLKVPFQCNNSGVVAALQKDSARDSTVMHLQRCLCFFVAHYQGCNRQSGWSGFGRTTISQDKKQTSILQKASNK